ncbi:uncharacterized protein LOC128961432 [Oppia nitens]|uniref:uncharacterized protein LOC128961432 n=1 Tax=Oppia nitens TaxID=1686743 RepID=UPI0023DB4DE2|nr:uncharacterized protein LOC128961432 [Oppia nitens]
MDSEWTSSADVLPIELIERILHYCTGRSFALSSRVSKRWLSAVQNIERTSRHFWRKCCYEEIENSILEDLNPLDNQLVDELNDKKCKEVYKRWIRNQFLDSKKNSFHKSNHSFGSKANRFDNISTVGVTGTLVVTGHRSGKVLIHDILNGIPAVKVAQHSDAVTDIAFVNICGKEIYELFETNVEMNEMSFANHHHIISVAKDHRILISLLTSERPECQFQICPLTDRKFAKIRVNYELFAVSTQQSVDISLFRLVVPDDGKVPLESPLRSQLVTTISLRDIFGETHLWNGIFCFANLKLNCLSEDDSLIANSDCVLNIAFMSEKNSTKTNWRWNQINALQFAHELRFAKKRRSFIYKNKEYCLSDPDDDDDDDDSVSAKIMKVFAFGESVFFLINKFNQILFSTDSKTFRLCPLDHWIDRGDRVTTIFLFASVVVCGTYDGFVYVHCCPSFKRLEYLSHYKPMFSSKVTSDPITGLSCVDNGLGLVLAVTTEHQIFLLNWFSSTLKTIID